jgi:two-component system alkaline phosphatase synthesis response regulator PhoP
MIKTTSEQEEIMMSNIRILVVDDEPAIANTVHAYLEKEGYVVHTALDGETALHLAGTFQPDLIVLDLMLPGMDGLDLLRELRKNSDVYVLVLTAKTEETDKIVGLTMGADDYMTKPFSPHELVARVKAILRRDRGENHPAAEESLLRFRRLCVDLGAHQATKDGQPLDLTPIEFEILRALARYKGLALSREQLIEQVWNYDYYGDDRVVDVHIGRLRKKIEDDPANPTLIVTVRGAGYRFEDDPA